MRVLWSVLFVWLPLLGCGQHGATSDSAGKTGWEVPVSIDGPNEPREIAMDYVYQALIRYVLDNETFTRAGESIYVGFGTPGDEVVDPPVRLMEQMKSARHRLLPMSQFDGELLSHRFWFAVHDTGNSERFSVSFSHWVNEAGSEFSAPAVWSSGKWVVGPPELWVDTN